MLCRPGVTVPLLRLWIPIRFYDGRQLRTGDDSPRIGEEMSESRLLEALMDQAAGLYKSYFSSECSCLLNRKGVNT